MEYLDKTNDVYVLGRLISEERLRSIEPSYKPAYIYAGQNKLKFLIEPISELPSGFPSIPYFETFAEYFTDFGFNEYDYPFYARVAEFTNFLSKKLIIFKPFRNGQFNNIDMKTIQVVKKPNGYKDDYRYEAVPVFSKADNLSLRQFEQALVTGSYMSIHRHISVDVEDTPELIIWDSDDMDYCAYGKFKEMNMQQGNGMCFKCDGDLKKIDFEFEWTDDSIVTTDGKIMFIESGVHGKVLTSIDDGKIIKREEKPEIQYKTVVGKEGNITYPDDNMEDNSLAAPQSTVSANEKEMEFINHLMSFTEQKQLVYDPVDLLNFHVAMKTSNLVILAGMSGTGKSQLVQMYGRSMGLSDEQIKVIPVKASWTDDSDLLGYLDTDNMLYRPADTGLVDTLKKAQNKDNIYIICFDEMNLSRVEHYFSQFLSVLEVVDKKRMLQLYNPSMESRIYNNDSYPSQIELGDNIIFVGTVNIDESTYHFSDKTLDRANVIRLATIPLSKLKAVSDKNRIEDELAGGEAGKELAVAKNRLMITYPIFNSFCKSNKYIDFTDREVEFLENLHNLLTDVKQDFGIGFRIIRQMDAYLKNIPANQWMTRADGWDLQLVQRVVPKIRGSEEQLSDILDANGNDGENLLAILNKYGDISEFKRTKKMIAHKLKELRNNGYTA